MLIRPASPTRDAEAIASIYAPYVTDTVVSFEEVPPTPAEMAERIDRLTKTHAWMVAEDGGEVLGYAYACASVGLHEACGFTLVGVYRQIGFKLGEWWDVGWWQYELAHDAGDRQPPEPGLAPRLTARPQST